MKILDKLKFRIRWFYWSRQLGSCKSFVKIGKNIKMLNAKCVHIGNISGIGDNCYFGPIIQYSGVSYTPRIEIGDGTWIGKNCSIASIHAVIIGKDVLFAGHVHITDHSHGYEEIETPISKQKLISKGGIVIGDQCWLGYGCEILSGVHVGRHSVVAARAVVTKNVPPFCIVAGNPAKIVKRYDFEHNVWVRVL
jgi:acetyltransferase-like isoleucine patch superfamily enzyme